MPHSPLNIEKKKKTTEERILDVYQNTTAHTIVDFPQW